MEMNLVVSSLLIDLQDEVNAWLKANTDLLTGERDLQVKLALHLEKSPKFDKVYTEYRVPLAELQYKGLPVEADSKKRGNGISQPTFPWNNDISVDIVVEHCGKFALLELKYHTKEIDCTEKLFGEDMHTDSRIIKNQAAADIVMYNYWKDVRRIEVLSDKFSNVEGGIALMIGNSSSLWDEPRPGVKYKAFSMHQDNAVGQGKLKWDGIADKVLASHPDFELSGEYKCGWTSTAIKVCAKNGDKFRAMMTVIK